LEVYGKSLIYILLALCLNLCWFNFGAARDSTETSKNDELVDSERKRVEGALYLSYGQSFLGGIGQLYDDLAQRGYGKTNDRLSAWGFGLQIAHFPHLPPEFFVDLNSQFGQNVGGPIVSDAHVYRLNSYQMMIDMGIYIKNRANFKLYTYGGFGFGGLMINLSEHGNYSFDELLSNPGKSVSLFCPVTYLDIGVGYEYLFFRQSEVKNLRNGYFIGFRIGYLGGGSMYNEKWQYYFDDENVEFSGGPELSLGGPYLYITMGYWHTTIVKK